MATNRKIFWWEASRPERSGPPASEREFIIPVPSNAARLTRRVDDQEPQMEVRQPPPRRLGCNYSVRSIECFSFWWMYLAWDVVGAI